MLSLQGMDVEEFASRLEHFDETLFEKHAAFAKKVWETLVIDGVDRC